MSRMPGERPYLTENRIWLSIAVGVVVAIVTISGLVWWDQRATDQECERLNRRVVTNQEEADQLFDDRLAAGCLNRE